MNETLAIDCQVLKSGSPIVQVLVGRKSAFALLVMMIVLNHTMMATGKIRATAQLAAKLKMPVMGRAMTSCRELLQQAHAMLRQLKDKTDQM